MSNLTFPTDRRYTKDHEWAMPHNGNVAFGVSAFAVEQLGDITLVNVDVKPGDLIEEGKAIGTIESVKTLSDIFAPLTGKVTLVNAELENKPELVNEDCYGKGWMLAIEPSNPAALEALMDAAAYEKHVESEHH